MEPKSHECAVDSLFTILTMQSLSCICGKLLPKNVKNLQLQILKIITISEPKANKITRIKILRTARVKT